MCVCGGGARRRDCDDAGDGGGGRGARAGGTYSRLAGRVYVCVCVAAAETADVLLTGGLQASSVAHATGLHCGSGRSCPQLAAGDIARS